MKVLVTGFGNFGTVNENPSEVLVKQLKSKYKDVEVFVFKGYKSIDDNLDALMTEHRPDVVLMFGLARKTHYVRLERIAKRPDRVTGTEQYRSTLPLAQIYKELTNKNIEVQYSDSAGSYWCNYLFYKVCQLRHADKTLMHGFIHIPDLSKYESAYKQELDLVTLGSTILNSVAK
jgi:pyroglutamyl-peptidase